MENIEKIKSHYSFTARDTENLQSLMLVMEKYIEDFPKKFYLYVKNFEDASIYLKDEDTIKRHQDELKEWFRNLFSGEYDEKYLREIEHIGASHVKIDLPCHYVNAAMHFVKQYCSTILHDEIEDQKERHYLTGSLEKLLDINLDVLTSSYIEEEIKTVFLAQRVSSYLIQFANKFSYGLNLILVIGLVLTGFMVLGLFVYDLAHLFEGNMESGLLRTLGSLLMLWVVIELVDTEVKHLKGAGFSIKVFISVALVSIIRKILVTSLKAEAVEAQLSLVIAVAVLGGVYWLVSKAEKDFS